MYGLKTTTECKQFLAKFSAPVPVKIELEKRDNLENCVKSGLVIHFGSISEALDALVLVNNRSVYQSWSVKHQLINRKMSDGTSKLKFSAAVTSLVLPSTVHTERDWLQDLKADFHSKIISGCSAKTREAVEKNEDVEVFNLYLQSINNFPLPGC